MSIDRNDFPEPTGPIRTARGERAERALANAVLELLDEEGFSGLSVDKIAARASVGKPTIYRRWTNKEALIAHVLGQIDPPEPIEPVDELYPALVSILTNLQNRFNDTRTGRIWQRLVGEADTYSEVIEHYEQQFILPRRRAVVELLRHHVQTGELRADLDVNAAMEMLVASMLGILMLPGWSRNAPSPDAIVGLLLDGMRA
jgi:AcrR family transcriptional regulator